MFTNMPKLCLASVFCSPNFLHRHDDILDKQSARFTPFIFYQFYLPDGIQQPEIHKKVM